MLRAFQEYKTARQEEQESLFLEGFATPSRRGGSGAMKVPSDEYVRWEEVESFLRMAEQALKVRTQRNEALCEELESARTERRKVEKTSSAAQEESSFLADHMQGLLDERTALKEALQKVQREKEYLDRENELLRQELLEGAALGEESSAALQLLARREEELRASQQRVGQLESEAAQLQNDNVQLQARVSALERANAAQSTAMLSCLEESERVRLQQLCISGACDSPLGTLAGHAQRSEFTDDSSCDTRPARAGGSRAGGFHDMLAVDVGNAAGCCELRSEPSETYVSCCATPLGSAGSSSGAAGSIFRSADSSPCEQQGQQMQQQHEAQHRQPAETPPGGSGGAQRLLRPSK